MDWQFEVISLNNFVACPAFRGRFVSSLSSKRSRGMIFRSMVLGSALFFLTTVAFAQADEISRLPGLPNQNGLTDSKIGSGLKEALRVGASNAVKVTGRPNGYFGNEAIKILMPKSLRPIEKALRSMGYGSQIDAFILSMNRSAEAAAPAAQKIFADAIVSMSFDDARKILSGGDTAATDYFKSKTTEQLTAAFKPVVEKTMDENGVTQQYKEIAGQAQNIPFMKSPELDITQYVVSKALDGLFYVLGEEERKIRQDPAAQTTNLLKEVFGKKS
jgi:hypothetical protein